MEVDFFYLNLTMDEIYKSNWNKKQLEPRIKGEQKQNVILFKLYKTLLWIKTGNLELDDSITKVGMEATTRCKDKRSKQETAAGAFCNLIDLLSTDQ